MRNRIVSVLTTWPFIFSLAVLLLNDRWLKSAFPGVVTGKLSDLAGIAVVALLLLVAWPNRRYWVCTGISVIFLWWKSPSSDPFISLVNGIVPYQIGRTVDYTDLTALAILPICWLVARNCLAFTIAWPALRKSLVPPLVAVTVFSILGTSVIPTRQDYSVRSAEPSNSLHHEVIAEALNEIATKHGLTCEDCTNRANGATYKGNGIRMTYSFSSDRVVSFSVEAFPDGLFFGSSGREKADALRASLKRTLAERFRSLEYVEQLKAEPEFRR